MRAAAMPFDASSTRPPQAFRDRGPGRPALVGPTSGKHNAAGGVRHVLGHAHGPPIGGRQGRRPHQLRPGAPASAIRRTSAGAQPSGGATTRSLAASSMRSSRTSSRRLRAPAGAPRRGCRRTAIVHGARGERAFTAPSEAAMSPQRLLLAGMPASTMPSAAGATRLHRTATSALAGLIVRFGYRGGAR